MTIEITLIPWGGGVVGPYIDRDVPPEAARRHPVLPMKTFILPPAFKENSAFFRPVSTGLRFQIPALTGRKDEHRYSFHVNIYEQYSIVHSTQ